MTSHHSKRAAPNGDVLAYSYDVLGRKTGVYDDVVSTATRRATWTYDTVGGGKGRLHTANRWVDGSAYIMRVRGYNELYQPHGEDYIVPAAETGLAGIYTFLHSYKVDGSPASDTYPGGSGTGLGNENLGYVYDAVTGLVERLTTAGNDMYVQETTYTALGEPTLIRYRQNSTGWVERGYDYDDATRRLTQSVTVRETSPQYVSDVRYSYDPAGNVTRVADVPDGGTSDIQCFEYDELRRLVEAWTPAADDCAAAASTGSLGGPAPYWLSWTFDDIGNRLTEVSHAGGGDTTRTYSYPAPGGVRPHALQSVTSSGPGGSSVSSYGYDDVGNTVSRPSPTSGTQSLDWDTEGRLAELVDGSEQHEFVYGADGDRIIRRDGSGKTLYLPGMEIRYTTSTGAKSATRYYSYVDGVFAMRDAFGLKWLVTDHQSTQSISISPTGGQAVTHRRQTPYGVPRGSVSGWPNLKGFVGGDIDPTGLTHIGAREYEPENGRFISVDPIMDLTDPQQMHGYSYSNGNPITWSDPSGLRVCGDLGCNQLATPNAGGGYTIDGDPRDETCYSGCGAHDSSSAADQQPKVPTRYADSCMTVKQCEKRADLGSRDPCVRDRNGNLCSALQLTLSEIQTNSASADVQQISWWMGEGCNLLHRLFDLCGNTSSALQALELWYRLVRAGAEWDHKAEIREMWAPSEYAQDVGTGAMFYLDIFSNVHYGYVGRMASIDTDLLLSVNNLPTNPWTGRSDQSDLISMQIGIDLFDSHDPSELSTLVIYDAIMARREDYLRAGDGTMR
ncbi:RHS repeat-associated protein [Micromonospora sp. Llam0]|uniref:RHS repeat-associated core domain-containing protein n=1 Tax=Micromonospora sp. Llam0 TaxID=2485143 RepID=UPI000F4A3A64|nr:RHS repeat-associated core domain-containing protein [Micromonospora sp. Llam0]ROO58637.1 RHS repeat-associated protein [Micromonospora sp. Llam0]